MKSKPSDKVIYRVQDVPTFDLSKVEFIDKLGEGKHFCSKIINLGAFGKVRLAKMIDGGGIIDKKNKENQTSSPSKLVKAIEKSNAEGSPYLSDETSLCAVKILSK